MNLFSGGDYVSREVSKELLVNRLRKIEGQVRGLRKMIGERRDCESIMTHLVAVRGAIEGVGNHLCFSEGAQSDAADSLARAIGIWRGALD